MTSIEPQLALRKLRVYAHGNVVYDETFHDGVNIIRGMNSSGKSTIADFIAFSMGADLNSWKTTAKQCDYVMAELEVNGAAITTMRDITDNRSQPMKIFFGTLNDAAIAMKDKLGWQIFPFKRSSNGKESFSQVFFKTLKLPEAHNDNDSNLTMHQLLRLIYTDQVSSVDSLMRVESFDSSITRETVVRYLFGMFDNELYTKQLEKKKHEKHLESASLRLNSAYDFLALSDETETIESVQKKINETEEQLEKLSQSIDRSYGEKNNIQSKFQPKLDEISHRLRPLKKDYADQAQKIENLQFDISDSSDFITNLNSRLKALENSETIQNFFGEIELEYCPQCLQTLDAIHDSNCCSLCGQEKTNLEKNTQLLRMKQELALQIKESKFLLTRKEEELNKLTRSQPILKREIDLRQKEFDDFAIRVESNFSAQLSSMFRDQGRLSAELLHATKQLQSLKLIEELEHQKELYEKLLKKLTQEINSLYKKQHSRWLEAQQTIDKYACYLLKNDLPREEAFKNASNVSIDIYKNTFALNEQNNFSASSLTYLRNCVHFGIFFASLDLKFFRYPRFILCDNIEDKGMEENRSQNFQKLIVDLSNRSQTKHQIIITTSMIASELDNSEYCVGEKYTDTNKSLKFPDSK